MPKVFNPNATANSVGGRLKQVKRDLTDLKGNAPNNLFAANSVTANGFDVPNNATAAVVAILTLPPMPRGYTRALVTAHMDASSVNNSGLTAYLQSFLRINGTASSPTLSAFTANSNWGSSPATFFELVTGLNETMPITVTANCGVTSAASWTGSGFVFLTVQAIYTF